MAASVVAVFGAQAVDAGLGGEAVGGVVFEAGGLLLYDWRFFSLGLPGMHLQPDTEKKKGFYINPSYVRYNNCRKDNNEASLGVLTAAQWREWT